MFHNTPIPQDIEFLLASLERDEGELVWLNAIDLPTNCSVAHIGSNLGGQTMALSRLLKSSYIVGIDKDKEIVQQARQNIEELRNWLGKLPLKKAYAKDAEEVELLKQSETALKFALPEFLSTDVTTKTTLPSDKFDLIFSDHTLYQIYCGQDGGGKLKIALEEITRLLKQAGVLAISEQNKCEVNNPIQWENLLSTRGLVKINAYTTDPIFFGIYKKAV